jgi:multidrug efflux pump subunit AcrA (membrane-fusion protein)
MRELSAKEIASRSTVDDVELESQLAHLAVGLADLERSQLDNQLQQARERLQQRTLRSPFVGVVTRRFKQAGETVEQLLPVVEVMSLDPLWIEFECPVAAEQSYRLGSLVQVRPAVSGQAPRTAQIIYLSWKATPASHTFLVRASMPNEDYSWRAGLKILVEPLPNAAATDVPAATPPAGK